MDDLLFLSQKGKRKIIYMQRFEQRLLLSNGTIKPLYQQVIGAIEIIVYLST